MTGFAARLTTILVLAGLALTGATASGAAASPARTPILGVMPHAGGQRAAAPLSLSKAVEAAGPTTLTFDSSYQTLIPVRLRPCTARPIMCGITAPISLIA